MKWLLATTLICSPVAAQAAPLTLFFTGLGVGAATAALLTQFTVGLGLQLINTALARAKNAASKAGQDVQVNIRSETATRWQVGGIGPVGGSVGTFAEKDSNGNLWYIVAHGDTELTGTATYILDGVSVVLSDGTDGFTAGDVITPDFCLDTKGAAYVGVGTKVPTFRLYTVTPTAGNPYGPLPAAFTTAFPTLPADFRLAGVCFTIVRCRALDANRYRNAMRYRGALGLGEPSVIMVGNFTRMYDPRNGAHDINNSATWTASTGNAAIVWAWWRTTRYGRARPMTEVNWTLVTDKANICDTTVLDRASVATPLYKVFAAFSDDLWRHDCEQAILDGADAYVAYDDQGRAYPEIGYYAAPTLTFSAARDIIGAQTQITDDGEQSVDGVVVNYIEPGLGYTRQPCAPWFNTDWYDSVSVPNLITVDVLTCQNHNQAVRLAKALGKRMAPLQKASLATTVKGILAKGQRAITLDWDTQFNGIYEIVSPVEESTDGNSAGFAVVPLAVDRWYLNGGEEGAPPSATPVLGIAVPNTVYPVPGTLASVAAAGAVGEYTVQFITDNDANQHAVAVYRGTTNVFTAATLIHTVFAGPNFDGYDTENAVAAGTYYIWAVPLNQAFIAGPTSGPYTVTVT